MKSTPKGLVPFSGSLKAATLFMLELADERKTEIGVREFYGGLYLGAFHQFVRMFANLDALDNLIEEECGLHDPVWSYWIRLNQKFGDAGAPPASPVSRLVAFDATTAPIVEKARLIAANKHFRPEVITLSDILIATDDSQDIPLCKKLIACGFLKTDGWPR
ncbi:MAG TPA: hypothetical protein VES66_02945 [Terriglobales bacterium]|nr:hypothetical protein [Terriglobales bacterium]